MFSLTVISLLVAGAWSQQAGMMTTMSMMMSGMKSTMPPPEPCCLPEAWQGSMIDLKSEYDVVSTTVYDTNKMMQGSLTVMRGSDQVVAHSLIDYRQQMMFIGDYAPGQAPSCIKEPFQMPMFRCMNSSKISDVTYIGSSTLGLKGMGIDYDGYRFKAGAYDISIALGSIPGSKDLCYPLLENVKMGDSVDSLYMFLQMTTKIENATILAMPAPCVANNAAVIG